MLTKPTTGAQWRANKTALVTLPSGNVAEIRAVPTSLLLVELGQIPDSLTPVVQKMMAGTLDAETLDADEVLKASDAMGNVIAKCALVSPRIVDSPSADDEISVYDLDDMDKEFLLGVFRLPTSQLKNFCEQQNALMESIHASEGKLSSAE